MSRPPKPVSVLKRPMGAPSLASSVRHVHRGQVLGTVPRTCHERRSSPSQASPIAGAGVSPAPTLVAMPRQPRTELAAGTFHVTSRGNRKCAVFTDVLDRRSFLSYLDDVVRQCRWLCLSYCLMTNHFHILVETPEPNLGIGMHRLNES